MSAEKDVIARLVADTTVHAVCADRIRPVKLKQDETLPAVTVQRVTADFGGSLQGDTTNKTRAYVQVDCYAKTYGAVDSLVTAVRTAMKSLTTSAGHSRAIPIDSTDFYEDVDETFRVSLDFYVWE